MTDEEILFNRTKIEQRYSYRQWKEDLAIILQNI